MLSGDEASYLTCGRGIHNSITHRKSNRKSSIQAKWMAPSNFEGEVIFRYTFLQEYKTFWVSQESEKIRVSRSDGEDNETRGGNKTESSDLIPSAKSSDNTIEVVEHPIEHSNVNLDFNDNSVLDDIPQPAQNAIVPKDSAEKTEKVRVMKGFKF